MDTPAAPNAVRIEHRFGRFVLLPAEHRLLVDGEAANLGPRAFSLLMLLVERAGKLVTKDEILSHVWPGLVVEENNLQVQISALRKVLGHEAIATIPAVGYRFVLPVEPQRSERGPIAAETSAPAEVYRVVDSPRPSTGERDASTAKPATHAPGRRRWAAGLAIAVVAGAAAYAWFAYREPTRPGGSPPMSLAVLPFKTTGDAPDESYAEAFTRDLTTGLAQSVLASTVVAHGAVVGYRGDLRDVRAIAKDLNVRYLVDGEVGRRGDQLAVALVLIDASNAKQVWGGRIETSAAKIQAWPALPIARATYAIRLPLYQAEADRLRRLSRRQLDPLEQVLLAYLAENDSTPAGIAKAGATCDEVLRLDPDLPAALHCKLWMLVEEVLLGPSQRIAELAQQADDLSRRAVAVGGNDAMAWKLRSWALGRLLHQWDAALEANANAIELDPSRFTNLLDRSFFLIWTGRPEEAFPLIERSADIAAGKSSALHERVRCRAYLALGRYDDAIASCERSASEEEEWVVHLYLAIAYAQVGDMTHAAAARHRALQRRPELSIDWYRRYLLQTTDSPKQWEQWDRYIDPGMHKAGFREK